ncbi:hypothetical protein JXO52_10285 [bacterium]|nr:hypothetical protein [bacterium]
MKLNAPKKQVWWIALILAALGVVGRFVDIPVVTEYSFWFLLVGYILLFLGTFLKGF